ncbi:hypothetical protein ACVWXD_002752 [Pseudomonas sp. TE3911]
MKQTANQDAYPEHSVVYDQGNCINARLPAIGSCRPHAVPGLHTRSAFIRTQFNSARSVYDVRRFRNSVEIQSVPSTSLSNDTFSTSAKKVLAFFPSP